ncbi:MAG: hypothetical protein FVQ81_05010 [Candidatus Glassbacteria bacterium]|nr:hypothetical protein [Candidatus Glassbacteria bacterium]
MNKPKYLTGPTVTAALFLLVLVIVIFALFSGNSGRSYETDFSVSGSMRNGVFVHNEWFSAEVWQVNREIARRYGLPKGTKGLIITELEGNPEVKLKLRNGDVITAINNHEIKNIRDFRKASRGINPIQGMFLDIQRGGHPMYVSVSGGGRGYDSRPYPYNGGTHPFTMAEVAPFMGRDFNVGGMDLRAGVLGRPIERWIESKFGSGCFACPKCGTLVPGDTPASKGRISCPNCNTRMVRKK